MHDSSSAGDPVQWGMLETVSSASTQAFGPRILEQAERLSRFTESATGITRTYLSGAHRQAGDYILGLMREAGMDCDYDVLGNVVGRYPGARSDASVLLTGSHSDSVVNAGRYDGLFGILSAIACVSDLHARGKRLSHAIEVVAFGDEEGVRFDVTMIGSAAMAGRFDPAWLAKKDAAGIAMADALRTFGGNPDAWPSVRRDPHRVAAFVESHIEQGPILLEAGLPVGVVTAIAGVTRLRATVTGVAGHAGTVPMHGRRDALAAAAQMALAVEQLALERHERIVATVGKFAVAEGGAFNVIPGSVQFTVDLRSGVDAERQEAVTELGRRCLEIAQRRAVELNWEPFFELNAAPCDADLQGRLAKAIGDCGIAVRRLPSGAGHDAMKFSGVVPMAMLFVRCGNGGISHNPLETMTAEDAGIATDVLLAFFENFATRPQP
jgi:allantoate deiminase